MSNSILILLSCLLVFGAIADRLRRHAARPRTIARKATASRVANSGSLPRASGRPAAADRRELPPLQPDFAVAPSPQRDPPRALKDSTPAPNDLAARLRDRYIAARFPELFGGGVDLANVEHVIRAARLYFDERKMDRAEELLDMALQQVPEAKALRLAQLEIAFLSRDPAHYLECAKEFRTRLGETAEWPEIARLGHALDPEESLFAASAPRRAHEHYGPWPDTPNWIDASWDLTSEVLAAEFHVALRATGASPFAVREAA